ncbi:MAG: hypothetical protein Q7J57_14835 [Gemmobacter sp.]|nr:hypothetical protein [Gemmobacter sp.]
MPNALAFLALLIWPIVVVVLFRRMPIERALIWSILGGYLFLPPVVAIDLPAVPPIDKMSIPALSAYLVCTLMLGHKVPLLPQSITGRALFALFIVAPIGTALTNPEWIMVPFHPPLSGLTLYDSLSIMALQAFVLMTWALARRFLATAAAMRELLIALVVGGLIYSIPMLIEIRLSPQMNVWIYGYFQHSFEQMMRNGGFRPIVFLAHGLWVAFFAMTALLAALALARHEPPKDRKRLLVAAAYLGVLLVLCKSVGSLIYGVALAPVVLVAAQRNMIILAAAMAVFALAYPMLRIGGYIPVDWLLEQAGRISPDRQQSLQFRFDNEALLLEHALKKPWFGWGGYERNLLHDDITGRVNTISDGRWVIIFGIFGWTGFIAEFGIQALPLLLLLREVRVLKPAAIAAPLGALALIHGVNMIDMLPNGTLTPLTWLIAGALLGHAEALAAQRVASRQKRESDMLSERPKTVI